MSRNCGKSGKISIASTLVYPSNPFYCQSGCGGGDPKKFACYARIEKPLIARLLHTLDILSAPPHLIPGYASAPVTAAAIKYKEEHFC